MVIAYRSTQILKLIARLLVIGVSLVSLSIPVLANETPIITNPKPPVILTGTAKDLQGTQERDVSLWLAKVEREYPTIEDKIKSVYSVYQVRRDSSVTGTESLNLTLDEQRENLGDSSHRNLTILSGSF